MSYVVYEALSALHYNRNFCGQGEKPYGKLERAGRGESGIDAQWFSSLQFLFNFKALCLTSCFA